MNRSMSFEEWLGRCRAALGFSQLEFAKRLNHSLPYYRKIEQGERPPTPAFLDCLVDALDASAQERATLEAFARTGSCDHPEALLFQMLSRMYPEPNRSPQAALRQILITHFNENVLRDICIDLNIDYEGLPGQTRQDKVRELIEYVAYYGRTHELVNICYNLRPNADWHEVGQFYPSTRLSTEIIEVLAEVKLILVGDGNVGKTSLVKRLVYDQFNPSENTTRSVDITHWNIDLPHADIRQARINIWDFGGQGNMHAAHPYFFSRRAIYLIVINMRENDRINRIEYWLRLIHTYGTESPIIIVSNKIDQFPERLDERTLKDKYSNIFEFVRTSCNTRVGIDDLRAMIVKAVCMFEDSEIRIPQSFAKLKLTLENMANPNAQRICDVLRIDEYEDLCKQHGIDAKQYENFLRRLNDLGVMLYFGDDARLELNVVLNPAWVIEGIYRVINHEVLIQSKGILRVEQIWTILPRDRYSHNKSIYILDIMCKFELCFIINEDRTLFLLPDLLPPQQPELPYLDRENALKLQFEYPVWYSATLTRLFVRLNHYLIENTYWRNGVLLRSFDHNNRALIIADEVDRRLRIWVDGNPSTRRNFLNRIREEIYIIHGDQRDKAIKEWVITSDGGEVSYQLLVNLEDRGKKTYDILIDNELVELNVKELLDGVRTEIMPDLYRLKELIIGHLSLDELDDLCFRLHISLEDIEGPLVKDAKARNLIRQFERTRRIPELMAVLRELRPDLMWA